MTEAANIRFRLSAILALLGFAAAGATAWADLRASVVAVDARVNVIDAVGGSAIRSRVRGLEDRVLRLEECTKEGRTCR